MGDVGDLLTNVGHVLETGPDEEGVWLVVAASSVDDLEQFSIGGGGFVEEQTKAIDVFGLSLRLNAVVEATHEERVGNDEAAASTISVDVGLFLVDQDLEFEAGLGILVDFRDLVLVAVDDDLSAGAVREELLYGVDRVPKTTPGISAALHANSELLEAHVLEHLSFIVSVDVEGSSGEASFGEAVVIGGVV